MLPFFFVWTFLLNHRFRASSPCHQPATAHRVGMPRFSLALIFSDRQNEKNLSRLILVPNIVSQTWARSHPIGIFLFCPRPLIMGVANFGAPADLESAAESVRTIESLSDQLRKTEKAQPGAFVTFRKPD